MRTLFLAALLVSSAAAFAQFSASNVVGDFTTWGSPVNNGDPVDDNARLYAQGGAGGFTLTHRAINDYETYARSFVGFKAQSFTQADGEDLEVQLPSNNAGGTSIATQDEIRTFGAVASNFGGSSYTNTFNGSIVASGNASAEILMQSLSLGGGSPYAASISAGAYSCTNLDNGAWDLDPTVGKVKIDRAATPSIQLNFVVPEYTLQRDNLSLFDNSYANPFYDRYSAGMLFFIVGKNGAQNGGGLGDGRFDHATEYAAGDMAARSLVGDSGTLTLNTSQMLGTYDFFGSDLIWDWMGDTTGFPNTNYPATGSWQHFQQLEVTVVPEPSTLAFFGLGLGALLLRRKR